MEKAFLDISRKEELVKTVRSFPVCTKFHKRFREKDAVKNACNGVATALEFIKTGNYFYFNYFRGDSKSTFVKEGRRVGH